MWRAASGRLRPPNRGNRIANPTKQPACQKPEPSGIADFKESSCHALSYYGTICRTVVSQNETVGTVGIGQTGRNRLAIVLEARTDAGLPVIPAKAGIQETPVGNC